jgi:hypothetical protein
MFLQEDQNRGKPNWEHLNDELHVLITVEDSENRAQMKLQRAIDEVKKLLTVVCLFLYLMFLLYIVLPFYLRFKS